MSARTPSPVPLRQSEALVGSYVRGRRDLCTDLDLLVLMHSDHDLVTRMAWLYVRLAGLLDLCVDMDIVAYTPEEFAQMRGRGFLKHALSGGQIIYERTD